MSSAYALLSTAIIDAKSSPRDSNYFKSILLSVLMISMSLSSGIVEVNQPTADMNESNDEFEFSEIPDTIMSGLAALADLIWPSSDAGEDLDSSDSLMTGARSSPPSLTITPSSVALIYGENVNPTITPTNSGGAVTSWSISPTLPSGLSFDTSTGTISGNPNALSSPISYTITGTNSFGEDDVAIQISVVQQPPTVVYPQTVFTNFVVGTQITDIVPTVYQGTGIVWSISPSLPGGLSIDTATGVISGTPSAVSPYTYYNVTAANSAGSDVKQLEIQVNDIPPSGITYSPNSFVLTKGIAMQTVTPTSSGGTVESWSITPSLPTGLLFDTVTGVISGTPSIISPSANYTVTATNTGGSSTAQLTFVVNDAPPTNVVYNPDSFTIVKGQVMQAPNTNAPTYSGGTVTSWTVSPSLPVGLTLNSNGAITGTPTVVTPSTVYTVTAHNSGGSTTANVTIQVNDVPPAFSYSYASLILETGLLMSPISPNSFAGAVDSWSVSPTLPNGISLDPSTGTISGTPTTITPSQTYTITATNTGGTASRSIDIEVNDQLPNIVYSTTSFTYTKGTTISAVTPTNSGGAVITWEVSPSLPAGLTLDSSTGEITGTPTTVSASAVYTVYANNSGGSDEVDLTIEVIDIPPTSITYTPNSFTETKGIAMSSVTPTSTGGDVVSWEISPDLPSGLSIDSSTGEISGTPSVLSTVTTYTIYANNTGGGITTTIDITVIDAAPSSISYNSSSFIETKGVAMSPETPTSSGGAVVTWSISPNLPSGLSIDSSTGVISGTPSVLSTTPVTYTITATNTGGFDTTTVDITINDVAPSSISYSGSPYTYTKGLFSMDVHTPTSLGGPVVSWSISPSVPSGMSFDTSTGAISGTPNIISSTTTYTVTATNSGGSDTTTIQITVNDASPNISYTTGPHILTKDSTMSGLVPISSGGAVVSWSISPSLPAGISIDSSGIISGTPTAISPSTNYTVTATNTGGTDTANFTLQVNDIIPSSISYSPNVFVETRNSAMTSVTPTVGGGGTVTSWEIHPSLPTGLSIDSTTGEISGTPIVISTLTTYTVYANNTGGSANTNIDITVNDIIPSSITYSQTSFTETKGTAMTSVTPTSSGGPVVTWEIHPSLPSGLSIDSSTGEISGTPTVLSTFTTYTVYANNTGGSANTNIDITVIDVIPSNIVYNPSSFTETKGTAMTSVSPTVSGGAIVSWEIHPSLPSGLSIDSTTGEISGTPTVLSTLTTYTVYANNTGGSANTNIDITVNDVAPSSITGVPNAIIETKGTSISPITPTAVGGGPVISWEIHPSLPSGLNFDSSTGEISGTPSVLSTLTTYTMYANNTGGSASTTIDITVNDVPPSSISYSTTSFTETRDTAMTSVTPTVTGGGPIITWEVHPSLPTGLTIDSSTGEIGGTPSIISVFTTYTVYANNTGGSASTTIDITVNDIIPSSITYSQTSFTETKGTVMTSVTPTSSGGPVVTWEIHPSLPSGLNIDSSTGEISGTPTVLSTFTTYTVYANNTGGSANTNIDITVIDVPPSSIGYSNSPFSLTKDSAFSSGIPSSGGGPVVTWSVSPTLPNGLAIDPNTGEISGTPNTITLSGTYTVTATNTGGSDSVTITIEVNDVIPSNVAYNPNTFVETKGTAMTSVTPTANGGDVTSWAVYPSLPGGISIDATTGEISGTPNALSTITTYTVYANNSGGSANTTIDITVNDVAPSSISYSPSTFVETRDSAMTSVTPSSSGGLVVTWSISPNLPSGLNFDTSTGEISGTPSVISPSTSYTITAENTGGSSTAIIDITVNDIIPSSITYSQTSFTETKGTAMTSVTPTSSGGPVVTWEIHPSLPSGLTIDSSTGEISGTPTVLSTFTTYTVYANNTGGSANTNIDITVIDVIPSNIVYNPSSFTETKGTAMTSVSPTVSGGAIVSWEIHPSLPSGLSIDSTTGEISGTPTVLSTLTTYTVYANNTGGSTNTNIDITVIDVIPSNIVYNPSSFTETKGIAMSSVTPTVTGGDVVSWEIHPSLPSGLTIDSSTGEISGTPSVLSTVTTYTVYANNTGGSANTNIDITVIDVIPSNIAYNPSSFTETKGTAMTSVIPTSNGGTVVTWEIHPSLPSGLSIDSSTGEISGTPSVLSTLTTYTVYANNTGGSANTNIDITVNDVPPSSIGYSNSPFSLTKDSAFSSGIPSSSGGPATSWSVSPTLPNGLSIDPNTGEISGTPTHITPSGTYTVTAANTGGSDSVTITIEVNDVIPSNVAYNPSSFTETKGTTMTSVTPTVNGGAVISWEIYPDLPSGLLIDSTTGEISGTPNALSTTTTYTVFANNSGGSANTTIDITVNDVAPNSLFYSGSPFTLTKNSAMTPETPSSLGGPVVTWSISPNLPSGLNFDSSNGEISGTPTVLSTITSYTVTGTNTGGSSSTIINITINDVAPSITYNDSPYTLTKGTPMAPSAPTITGGTVTTWSVSPSLPAGLSLDLSTGVISGTPSSITTTATFEITASNTGGSDTATISITVNDVAPSSINYNPSSFTLIKGTAMTPVTPNANGGVVTSWSVSPTLPSGISIDPTTGEISGTPSTVTSSATYTVTAQNSGGSATAILTIEVLETPPSSISYSPSSLTLTKGTPMTSVIPTASGDPATSWSITPSLPTGLNFGVNNGTIWGTPTVISSSTSYLVTASNNGGSGSTNITIQVNDIAPSSISYNPSSLSLSKDSAMNPAVPTSSGGTVVSWAVYPNLPSGLSIDSSTGIISGTPTAITPSATYTVYGNNTGGSASATVTIIVNDAAPSSISYSPSSFTLTKGVSLNTVTPSSSGGTVESWSISPTLPSGLNFDTSTGAISGNPSVVSPMTSYTVTATNAGGTGTATITIQINDIAPSGITYSPNTVTLTKDSVMSPLSPSSSGGTVVSWSISPSLPTGLVIDSSTGEISGTPTVVSSTTTYTVTGNNTGGSTTASVIITVTSAPPSSINYSPSTFTLTKGTPMTSVIPTATGDPATSWSISPNLPSGLSLDTSTGEISGTPSVVSGSANYTVFATNDGGTGNTTITIEVIDIPPSSISYNPSFLTLTKDSTMTAATPTSSGGTVVSWTISTTLPSGLVFDTSTGEISGTPTVVSSAVTYTVTAINSGGSASGTVTILINDAPPSSISYTPSSFTLTKDVSMSPVIPTAAGGAVDSWSINPALPTGLSFNTSTGEILGTPTVISTSTNYTVTATNAGGSGTAIVTIEVNDVAPYGITYSGTPYTLTKGSVMTADTPTANGGAVTSWAISPSLPAGLSFSASNGEISGTPTEIISSTSYTVTAFNSGGNATTTIIITVNDITPSNVAYSGTPFTLTKGTAMTPNAPTSSGGAVVSWSISPSLPSGLLFDTSTGEISGTPTTVSSSTNYTVTATNTGGTASTIINILINDAAPIISYNPSTLTLTKGTAMTPAVPSSAGGAVVTWSISPALPGGLSFSLTNGEISGTPNSITSSTNYTVTATNAGGTDSQIVTIVVNDIAPSSVSYTPNSFTLEKGSLMTTATPQYTGGTVTSWSISPTLPTGLVFSTSTGEISGTPTVLSSTNTYTVLAINSGGSATATVTITVTNAPPSSITYTPSSFTLTKDIPMTAVTPNANGDPVDNWSISPTLPAGLSFDNSTGEISGTPTIVSQSTSYTVTATNNGGSGTAIITIEVQDVAPSSVSYNPTFITLTKGSTMNTALPSSSGGAVTLWEISDALPAGLSFSSVTGAISGTPTAVSNATTYTVTASNSGGSASTTVTILVNDAPPSSVSYTPSSLTLTKDVPMSSVTPTSTGGAVVSWSVSPALPAGLTLNTSTGEISGTPTAVSSSTPYTVTATNAGGSSSATVTIQVNDLAPYGISYGGNPFTLTKDTVMIADTPTANGGAVTSWAISPSLPAGLSFSSSNGEISGTPTEIISSTSYTVTAFNSGGNATTTITITVNDIIPSSIVYSGNPFTLTKGTAMTPNAPTSVGGTVISWAITPALPTGLNFDTSNGEISGTPTTVSSSTNYTVTATNTGGTASTIINILINDAAPLIGYSQNSYTLVKGTAISINPTSAGGTVVTWSISPSLPAGLSLSTTSGEISGTPSVLFSSTNFTVTATNDGGADTATLAIEVIDVAPSSVTYTPNSFSLEKNTLMPTVIPTSLGGTVDSWSISPALPAGLLFSTSNGAISGTPTAVTTSAAYTVTATNTGGSATTIVTIEVTEESPSITYATSSVVLQIGLTMSPLNPTSSGGPVSTWLISPTLPGGLTFNNSTGEISGTPTVVSQSTSYTVTAINNGGTDIATVTIQVNDVAPSSVSYNPSFLSLTKDSLMTPASPVFSGGAVTLWQISDVLPAGLAFSSVTGTISGTPTAISTATTYTVTASNSGGSASTTVTILVNDAAPSSIAYSPSSSILTKDVTMTNVTPTYIGGTVLSWAISPSLPAGLTFNLSTGTIGGTPTTVSPSTLYTVTATNAGGTGSTTVTIQVNDLAPYSISYSGTPFTLTKGVAMTADTPTANGGTITSWSIAPSLPTGLNFDTATGEISGTPTVISTAVTYTVFAFNTGGNSSTTIQITVNDASPSSIAYGGDPYTLSKGTTMTPDVPTFSGGAVVSWSITPALPSGLNFNTSNGEISGTPSVIMTSSTYTVTANNSGGSASVVITIVINDIPPSAITYSGSPVTLTKDSTMSPVTPTSVGGAVESWSISPTLPAGLTFDNSTGEISGTPTVITPATTFTVTAFNSGGSGTGTITIQVDDIAPSSITYTPNSFSLSKDSAMIPVTPNSTGGAVVSWSVSPNLPVGLVLDTSTGEISGTPTAITPYNTYTVTANNTGGSVTTTLTIIVNDAPPSITYSPNSYILTKGTAMTNATPTSTGGVASIWSISPALPGGLFFNTSTGEISGTPTAIITATNFVITAINAGGSGNTTLTIQINDIPPTSIAYPPNVISLAKDSAMTPVIPTSTGGAVTLWQINPSLPAGLIFDTATGEISGTPTAITSVGIYTVIASNSGGATQGTVSIIVNDAIPTSITYTPNSFILTKGASLSDVIPTSAGGAVVSWSISPALPTGLSINTTSGAIGGTPTVLSPSTIYTVTATNAGGSGNTTVTIQVNDIPPFSLSYSGSPFTLTNGTAMTAATPTLSGGAVVSWSITPALPAGLSLDNNTGEISGTPTVTSPSATYTITANNSGGSATATVTITINDQVPSSIVYSGSPFTLTKGTTMVADTPASQGGSVDSWSISPALPAGLVFNTSTGEISGTPTSITPSANYTITATNTGGSDTVTITLAVNDVAPSTIIYSGTPFTLTKDSAMTSVTPSFSGGVVESWSISPALPAGLVFDNATGEISGTPTVIDASTTYTVTATNSGGSDTTNVTITVIDIIPEIYISVNELNLINNTVSADLPLTPTVNGSGAVVSWTISPSLPAGLYFDNSTGVITGTPAELLPRSMFMITGTNTGGSANAYINITIIDQIPSVIYSPDDLNLDNNTASNVLPLLPTVTGDGAIVSWAITPDLPAGLVFDNTTGTISGTPSELLTRNMYTIVGTNTGGSVTTYINITIVDEIPNISYSPSELMLTNNTISGILPLSPTISGSGEIISWSIEPSLPEGLAFDTSTGVITGTPTEIFNRTMFVINGTNTGGIVTSFINITIQTNEPVIFYIPNDITLLSNSSILDQYPISTGGLVTEWSITPELSPGLYFNNTTGHLSGMPTELTSRTQYTVTATNDDGVMYVNLNITVEETVYEATGPIYLVNGSIVTSITPPSIISGSTFEIHPELPEGMSINETNGTISGTPTEPMELTNFTIYSNSSLFNDSFMIQLEVLEDSDGDGLPDSLPDGYIGDLSEDLDDDEDGFSDIDETDCMTESQDANSIPLDLDGDGICDALDDDKDGDGIDNIFETETGIYNSTTDTGTDPANPDSDGDGVCDGPATPNASICTAGPDAFPNDPSAWEDSDGDGQPDEIVEGIETNLTLDTDDDNDGWSDEEEAACGTISMNGTSVPLDGDVDGICDALDIKILGYSKNGVETNVFEAVINQTDFIILPNLTGMESGTWSIIPALPAGLEFSGSMARSGETGIITGIPTETSPMTNYTVFANNSQTGVLFNFSMAILADTDNDGLPDGPSVTGLEVDDDDDGDGLLDDLEEKCGSSSSDINDVAKVDENGDCVVEDSASDKTDDSEFNYLLCCLPLLLLLLLLLLIGRKRSTYQDAEPENTTSKPKLSEGEGTEENPFVLKPAKTVKAGGTIVSKEVITINNITPNLKIKSIDFQDEENGRRFTMQDQAGSDEGVRMIEADDEGVMKFRLMFDDSFEPTLAGGEYQGAIKVGRNSVYFVWDVKVKPDPEYVKEQKKIEAGLKKEDKELYEKAKVVAEATGRPVDSTFEDLKDDGIVNLSNEADEEAQKAAKAAEEKAAKEAKAAEEKAAKEAKAAEDKAAKEAKAAEEKAAKEAKAAEEKAAKEAKAAEDKAAKEAKAAEEKAAKEAKAAEDKAAEEKAKAEAEAKAAKAAEEKAAKEAKAAEEKAKAEAEAKAAKEAEEKAKKAAAKPATKEVKKQEELERVKSRAKTIDFKTLGTATETTLKTEVKKGATTLEVANAAEFEESGTAALRDETGSSVISWTGKQGNALTGVTGVTRVFSTKTTVMVKDDLQVIKGIGPFIEEKLNALGITTYRQIANMNAKLETQVNEAIEFFPGRVKRDQWVAQAKILLGEDVKLDEKALKEAEELERIAQKAETIDFATLGVATFDEKDDLQIIKGIGPFIAEKLYALGIYTFEQVGNMTPKIEEEVNKAIEFFPGRVKRDEWAKQAKELAKNKK